MKRLRLERAAGVFAGAVAFVAAASLLVAGALERIDLALNDRLVRAAAASPPEDRLVMVLEREQDLRRWGHPLSDETLALLVERILSGNPVAVGVDKYRDPPVAPGEERLARLLAGSDRVFWVEKFAPAPRDAIPAPAALDRRFVGCGDIVDDLDGNVRRALLYLDAGERTCSSLAFQLARHAAAARGTAFTFAPDGAATLKAGKASIAAIDPGDGPYARADTAGFQVAVPSARGLPPMRTVSLSEVLDGRVPPETFRGRIVIFGSGADSLRDFFNIPGGGDDGYEKIAGAQAHALIVSHLLRASAGETPALVLAPRHASLFAVFLLALAGGWLGCARRPVPFIAAAGLLLLVAYGAALEAHAAAGRYLAPGAPALALALALGFGVAYSAWRHHRERDQLMSMFSRHVSREVAEDLWARRDEFLAGGTIEPRAITATVLFLDIRGFTTVSEQLDPARAVPWLNRGLAAMTETIMAHGGVVTRFVGDAIMAVFGAPVSRTNPEELAADARRAIAAGLAIGPALDALNREFAAAGLPPIRVRIGINTGPMTQCSVGAASRHEFTVLGDAVNTAARLESHAMEDTGETARLLIGERTRELAGESFETRHVGTLPLKGKVVPVSIHQVLSSR